MRHWFQGKLSWIACRLLVPPVPKAQWLPRTCSNMTSCYTETHKFGERNQVFWFVWPSWRPAQNNQGVPKRSASSTNPALARWPGPADRGEYSPWLMYLISPVEIYYYYNQQMQWTILRQGLSYSGGFTATSCIFWYTSKWCKNGFFSNKIINFYNILC